MYGFFWLFGCVVGVYDECEIVVVDYDGGQCIGVVLQCLFYCLWVIGNWFIEVLVCWELQCIQCVVQCWVQCCVDYYVLCFGMFEDVVYVIWFEYCVDWYLYQFCFENVVCGYQELC